MGIPLAHDLRDMDLQDVFDLELVLRYREAALPKPAVAPAPQGD